MAKKKLIRFEEMKGFDHVKQPQLEEFWDRDYALKGKWKSEFFENTNPLVLELACGKGEYAVNMAKTFPSKNFLGVDIKGARIWYGAKKALDENITNAKFLRTRIDFIDKFFASEEVDEIWITFPDPQPQDSRERKRLTNPMFIERYRKFLKPGGKVHLKTDADSFFEYTQEEIEKRGYRLHQVFENVYQQKDEIPTNLAHLYLVQTHYEKIFSAKGHTIKYLCFTIN